MTEFLVTSIGHGWLEGRNGSSPVFPGTVFDSVGVVSGDGTVRQFGIHFHFREAVYCGKTFDDVPGNQTARLSVSGCMDGIRKAFSSLSDGQFLLVSGSPENS